MAQTKGTKKMEKAVVVEGEKEVGFGDRFEEDMARYTGAKRAVVCVSGTNALHMSLLLSGVKKDDEVITQALTFIATCNALSYIGAEVFFFLPYGVLTGGLCVRGGISAGAVAPAAAV